MVDFSIRLIEVVLGFIIFSSLIMINVIVTRNFILVRRGGVGNVNVGNVKKGLWAKTFILFMYFAKFFIYAGAIFLVDKLVGITFSFILGILLSLGAFLFVSLILTR